MRRRIFVVVLATAALLFSGVAVAQETPAQDDPQAMCEAAGGDWDGTTCFNVWCGFPDDPAICAWMAAQAPTVPSSEPAAPVSPGSSGARPQYTG